VHQAELGCNIAYCSTCVVIRCYYQVQSRDSWQFCYLVMHCGITHMLMALMTEHYGSSVLGASS
jgi:hypothetical protein